MKIFKKDHYDKVFSKTETINITKLLHDITQNGYIVSFNSDFKGMVRIDYTKEYEDAWYEHAHVGCPGRPTEELETNILKELERFSKFIKE